MLFSCCANEKFVLQLLCLRRLADNLPQIIPQEKITALCDEWNDMVCNLPSFSASCPLDIQWRVVFETLKPGSKGTLRYPLLTLLLKASLTVFHANADVERGFSENKNALDGRSALTLASVNGLRQVKSYLRRLDDDVTKVTADKPMLRAVRGSYKAYRDRIASKKKSPRPSTAPKSKLMTKEQQIKQRRDEAEKKLLAATNRLDRAREMINKGLAQSDIEEAKCGQLLLDEASKEVKTITEIITQCNKEPDKSR